MKWLLPFLLPFSLMATQTNLVPNSSFECGTGRGWMYYGGGDQAGNVSSISARLNSTANHGAKSFEVTSRLISRPIWLNAGTYTFSMYVRAPSNLSVNFGIMDSGRVNQTPPSSATATNGWQRVTSTFTAASNFFYNAKIYHVSSTIFPLVDAVQVESGSSATAYAPAYTVEAGLDTADQDNMLFSGDTKQFRFRYWNEGAAVTNRGEYIIYDWLNRTIVSSQVSHVLAAGTNTTVAINLPATNGYLRIVSRLYGYNDSWDETSVAILPYTAGSGQDTNGFLGTHPNYSVYHMNRARRGGFSWARDLSPAQAARWVTIEPTRGSFSWNDTAFAGISTNGLVPVCNLFPGVTPIWPTWATNGDGTADFLAYSNFCYVTVARYSVAPYNVHYWETINEPNTFTGTGFPVLTNAPVLAMVITQSVAAIRAADPSAYIIGLGGMAHAADGWDVWTNLPSITQSNIDAISAHIYPQDNSDNPNASESDVHFTSIYEWWGYFGALKPVWNTETGTFSTGGYKTLNSMLQGNYDLSSSPALESSRIERQARSQAAIDRHLYACLRTLGWGYKVYMNYWSKYFNDQMVDTSPTDPTIAEYNCATKPHGVAVLIANKMAGIGLGRLTNSSATKMDAFVFTNSLGTSIAAWNYDRGQSTLTTTNANVAVYDCMGNQLQTNSTTLLITRTPKYLVSGSLTTAQLSNTVKYASVSTNLDTTAPNISIDIAPSGLWDTNTPLTLVKWSGHDENKLLWTTTGPATNIVYKWHVDSDADTSYSASNHAWLPTMAAGNHTLTVKALDSAGNESTNVYTFAPDPIVIPTGEKIAIKGNRKIKGNVTFR